jgi:hypothetical protein
MIIYDKEGNPKELESVDAREYVATGRWFYAPPKPEAIPEVEVIPEAEETRKGRK